MDDNDDITNALLARERWERVRDIKREQRQLDAIAMDESEPDYSSSDDEGASRQTNRSPPKPIRGRPRTRSPRNSSLQRIPETMRDRLDQSVKRNWAEYSMEKALNRLEKNERVAKKEQKRIEQRRLKEAERAIWWQKRQPEEKSQVSESCLPFTCSFRR